MSSNPSEWRYINTKLNPADHASRSQSAESLVKEEKWIKAPNFLLEPEEQWPKEPLLISEKTVIENDPEVKKVIVEAVITSSPDLRETTTECVNKLFKHYSLWYLLKRGVAWILKLRKELLRCANIQKLNSLTTPDDTCDKSDISCQNLKEAD